MATYANSTQAERDAVQAAFNAAAAAASTAQALYQSLAASATDPGDQANYAAAAQEAGNDLALVNAQLTAYMNDSPLGDVSPPDDATVQQVQSLSTQLAQLTVTADDGQTVLQLITETLQVVATL